MQKKRFLATLLSAMMVMSTATVSAFAEESETHTHNYTGEDVKVTAKITIPAPSEEYWKQGSTITLTNDAEFTLESIDAIICRAESSEEVIDSDIGLYAKLSENTISLLADRPPTNHEQDSLEIKVSCLTSEAMESDSFSAELDGVDLTVSNNPVNDFRAEPIEGKNSHKAYCVYSDCEEYIEEECSFTDGVCVCGRVEEADVAIPAGTIEFTADEPVIGEKLSDLLFYIEEPYSEMATFYVEWMDQEDTIIEKCQVYTVSFGISPNDGYYFDEDSGYKYKFNGETRQCGFLMEYDPIQLCADTIKIDTHNRDENGICADCSKTAVSEVKIKFTNNETGYPDGVENNGGVGYTVSYQWYVGDKCSGEEHDNNTAFEAGETYSCKITITPEEGYTLDSLSTAKIAGWGGESVNMSVDGSGNGIIGIIQNPPSSGGNETPEIPTPDKSPINYISFNVAKPVAGKPAETYGTIDESSKSLSITAKTESGETLGTSDLKSYYAYIMEVDTEKNTGGWNVYRDNYVAGSTYALLYDIKTYNEIADDCEVYVNGVKAIAWPEEFTYSGDLLVYERLTDGYGVAGLKGFYVSYPSSSGGSSSSGSSSSSSSSSTTEPEKTEEKVDVKTEADKIEKAEEGAKVEVKIEGTVVPKDYIESAKESKATVVVDYGAYAWEISDVTEPKAVDLSINTDAKHLVNQNELKDLKGDSSNVIDIKHNGKLGFKGTLKYNVKKENAGKYVNLYYYNIETGKLELQGSTKIDEKGFVHLPFTHCSTYVLNITSDPATSTLFEDLSAGESATVVEGTLPTSINDSAVTDAPATTDAAANPETGNSAAALMAIPMIVAAAVIISKKR